MFTGIKLYGLAALALLFLALAGYGLYEKQRGDTAFARVGEVAAQFEAYRQTAQAEASALRERAAHVETQVITEYKDRIVTIRVPSPPEVIHDIQVLRDSHCELPAEFRVLHDSAAVDDNAETPAGVNDSAAPVDCATAIETVRENYKRARENAAQLGALQKWAASVAQLPS